MVGHPPACTRSELNTRLQHCLQPVSGLILALQPSQCLAAGARAGLPAPAAVSATCSGCGPMAEHRVPSALLAAPRSTFAARFFFASALRGAASMPERSVSPDATTARPPRWLLTCCRWLHARPTAGPARWAQRWGPWQLGWVGRWMVGGARRAQYQRPLRVPRPQRASTPRRGASEHRSGPHSSAFP